MKLSLGVTYLCRCVYPPDQMTGDASTFCQGVQIQIAVSPAAQTKPQNLEKDVASNVPSVHLRKRKSVHHHPQKPTDVCLHCKQDNNISSISSGQSGLGIHCCIV